MPSSVTVDLLSFVIGVVAGIGLTTIVVLGIGARQT
jgi:hypothetical protein